MRTKTFPIGLALPWGLTSALLPYFPLPAQTTVAFGPPISFAELIPGGITAATAAAAAAYASDPGARRPRLRPGKRPACRPCSTSSPQVGGRFWAKKKPAGKGGLG